MIDCSYLIAVTCTAGFRNTISIPDNPFVRIVAGQTCETAFTMFGGRKLIPLLMVLDKFTTGVNRIGIIPDVHGMIFPYDFIRGEETDHSLAHI